MLLKWAMRLTEDRNLRNGDTDAVASNRIPINLSCARFIEGGQTIEHRDGHVQLRRPSKADH